ncbi:PKD domain-containing protein [Aureispira anguillae]|uniref:PKD domain-containing protein n=1 Tax=Aureispira anguillae TaxID=2864201 RepID=A0A916DY10_9BACT|nr:PKD domain-containing protein [Aureispira anguillae]BDS15581.1 PKD domain-containing protein [Aureispira anguillae]
MNNWRFFLISLLLCTYTVLNAQTTYLDIETTPPDSIIVCGDSAFFSVEVTNTHSQALTNLIFNPKMIPGILYIPGSVTGMQEHNISTPHEPLFSLGEIDAGETFTLTFYVKAECSIINQIINLGGSSSSGGLATNQTRIDYLENGIAGYSLELNGSNSYNILYADIFISTITNQVMQTIPGATYTRNISIQNGGLGKIESLTLLIDFESGVAVSGTNIGNFSLSGQLATVTLGPAEFAMFGNGDGYFELDEVITLVDTVTMLSCIGGETEYTAFWGCNPTDTCQQDQAYANSILIGGQPVIASDIVTNQPTFFGCADTGIVAVEYTNIGTESSAGGANYYNITMRYQSNQEMVNYVGAMLNGVDLFAAGIPTQTTAFNQSGNIRERTEILFDNFFTTDPDGAGGLEDLDNDGYYDDMAAGDTLLITYSYLLESPSSFSDCPVDFYFQFFRESICGYNNCGDKIWGLHFRNAHIQGEPTGAPLTTGPSDIFAGDTITVTFQNSFEFDESGRFKSKFPSSFISVLKCDNSEVKTYLELDAGFSIVPGSVLVNGQPTTFSVNGNTVTINGGQLIGREANNHFSLDLTYDCSVPVTLGGHLEWRSVLSCDCGDEINLGCQSQFIARHCPGVPCFGTRAFEVTRTTLGWTDATQTTRVSPSTPGLALNRAYQCDTIRACAPGYVAFGTGLSLNNAHVKLWYEAPGSDQSFNYGRGEWSIYDASTGTTHTVPTTAPFITSNGAPAATYQMIFDATNAITSTVGTLEEGDSLNIKLYMAINKTNDFPLGAYQFPTFRAQHGHVDANGDTLVCSSFGAILTVLKTKTFIQDPNGSTHLGHFDPCSEHKFRFGSQIIGGLGILDDFPNEFRPVNVWDDTLCYTLPVGMAYVPNSIKFNNSLTSSVIPAFDPITRKLTLIGSDLFPGGWPILDRVDDRIRTIEFSVSRDCDVVKGDHIIPSKYGYTDFASAPTPSCYEYTTADTDWEIIVNKPNIKMDAALPIIEGFESDLEWNIRVCNNGNIHSANNWIYINDLSGNLTIVDIVDLSNGGISLPFIQTGFKVYVNIGSLLETSCVDLLISAMNSDCVPNQVNSLEVISGWSCSPDLMYNPNSCHTDTIPLQYISRTANLQTQVTSPSNNLIDICTPFDFSVLLVSSLEANMDQIVHFIDLPAGLTILPGATYEYPLGSTPQPLPTAVDQFGANTPGWRLTQIIPGLANGFVGTRDTLRNKLRLNYSLVASCDYDPYNLIDINSHGTTNCGELVDLIARKNVYINGFPPLDTTKVALSVVDNSSNCVNQVKAIVDVTNQSTGNLNPLNRLEVILPAGMDYIMGSHIPDPTIQTQAGGIDILSFAYPNPLASGATASFNFDLAVDRTIDCGPYEVVARSIFRDSTFCASSGDSCLIGITTDADTATVAVQTLIDAAFTPSVIEPCLGDSFTLTSTTICGTHFWDFGDGNTSTAINPTHIYNGTVGGIYTITHIVSSPCGTDTSLLDINVISECCQLNINTATTAINCYGSCDGTATVIVSNGAAPYNYLWSNGATDASITGLCAGTHEVTVTDLNGCTITASVTLANPTILQANVTTTDASCYTTCDGSIATLVNGGTAPYTFLWSNGATDANLNGLCQGNYIVTITDANGCTLIDSATINSPAPLDATLNSTNATCHAACDGSIATLVNGGTAPYTFLWSNGATDANLNGLCQGNYIVTITDANGCTNTLTATVTEPTPLDATLNSTNATCHAACDGSIATLVNGGTAPYTFLWSNGATDANLNGLCQGNYIVTITDANGCTLIDSATINSPAPLDATLNSTNATCHAACDGSIATLVNGGTAPYTFLWSNGATDANLNGLCQGNYIVTITDANGCTLIDSATINSPAPLDATLNSTNATCHAACDGSIATLVNGGTAPYTFLWSNGATDANLNGLCQGNYIVTITDANGCTNTLTATVTEPAPLDATLNSTNATCHAACDGSIATLVNGGTAPYTFLWSNGATDANLNGLCQGNYIVTITDANGCTNTLTATITEPTPLSITITTTDPSCNSLDTTTVCTATAWNNSRHAVWLPNLPNTPDSKFIFENNSGRLHQYPNGTARITGTIVNRSDVNKRWVVDVYFTNGMNWANWSALGRSYKDESGLVGQHYLDWTYYIMDVNQANTLTGLGDYSGTVLNLTHKPSNYTFGLQVGIAANSKDTDYGFSCWFDYTSNGSLVGHGDFNGDLNCIDTTFCDGTAVATVSGGTAPYSYNWSNGSSSDSLQGLCPDTLTLTITDANGCSVDTTVVINATVCCSAAAIATNTTCAETCDGTVSVTNTGGSAPYSYLWSNGATSAMLNNLCAGSYSVTVTDANGCISTATAIVTSPAPILVSIDTSTDETCAGNDGTVNLNVSGGTSPYSVDLANFTTSTTYSNASGAFTGLNAGQYIVNVEDANGCRANCATAFTLGGCTTPVSPIQPQSKAANSNLIVSPNSTSSLVQIKYQTTKKEVSLSILDVKGKTLLTKENLDGTGSLEISTKNWSNNTYLVLLKGENNQVIQIEQFMIAK